MVFPCPVAGWRFVEAGVPRRAIVFYYVPADWGPRNFCNNYCESDAQCVIFGGKTKCGKCVPYGDGVRKWCQEPEKDKCERKCKVRYDCANDGGKWDKGCPWMGSACEDGFCKKTYKDCSSNSDCTSFGTKCGPEGFCVGK